MKWFLLILSCISLTAISKASQTPSEKPVTLMSFPKEELHRATLQACQGLSRQEFDQSAGKLDLYLRGFTVSPVFNEILEMIYLDSRELAQTNYQFKQPSIWALWLVNQESYKKALQDCYGSDGVMKSYFNKLVFQADMRGKVIVGALMASSFVAAGKVLQWIHAGSKVVAQILAYGLPTLAVGATLRDIARNQTMKAALQAHCQQLGLVPEHCQSQLFVEALERQAAKPETGEPEVSNSDFFKGVLEQEIKGLQSRLATEKDTGEKLKIEHKLKKKQDMLMSLPKN